MSPVKTKRNRLGIAGLVASALASCAVAGDPVDPTAASLLSAHNRERGLAGRKPLKLSTRLCESAAVHARDMATHGKLEHKGSDGSTVADRVKRKGYTYVRVGENIAEGQKTVDHVMTSWMESPGHRENILDDFTEMGAARAEDNGNSYWCVNFGIPMPRLKPDEAAAAVVKEINRDRVAGKHAVLKVDPALGRAAMAISAKMAARDSLELGSDPFALLDENAMEGRELGVKLSANVPTAQEAAKALVSDDGAQLVSYRQIGAGYAVAKSGMPYWCAIFAKPLSPRRPGSPKKGGSR
jgi:uncharacterized protein YkwD